MDSFPGVRIRERAGRTTEGAASPVIVDEEAPTENVAGERS